MGVLNGYLAGTLGFQLTIFWHCVLTPSHGHPNQSQVLAAAIGDDAANAALDDGGGEDAFLLAICDAPASAEAQAPDQANATDASAAAATEEDQAAKWRRDQARFRQVGLACVDHPQAFTHTLVLAISLELERPLFEHVLHVGAARWELQQQVTVIIIINH